MRRVNSIIPILLSACLAFTPIYELIKADLNVFGLRIPGVTKYALYLLMAATLLSAAWAHKQRGGTLKLRDLPKSVKLVLLLLGWSLFTVLYSPASAWQSLRGINVNFAGGLVLFLAIWLWAPNLRMARRIKWVVWLALALFIIAAIPEVISPYQYRVLTEHSLIRHYIAGDIPQLSSLTSGPNPFGTILTVFFTLTVLLVSPPARKYIALTIGGIISGMTHARSAWLGTAIMGGGYFISKLRSGVVVKWPVVLALSMFIGLSTGTLIYGGNLTDIITHGESTEQHGEAAEDAIGSTANQNLGLTLFGYGIGTAGPVVFNTPLEKEIDRPLITESWYLQLVQEIGFIGLALYIWMYTAITKLLYRREPLMGWLAVGLAINAIFLHTWSSDANVNLMFWALAGIYLFERVDKTAE